MTKFQQGKFSETMGRTEDAREAWAKIYERFYVVVVDSRGFASHLARTDKLLVTDFSACEHETEASALAALAEMDRGDLLDMAVQRLVIAKARSLPCAWYGVKARTP